jgi:hypothetical protein
MARPKRAAAAKAEAKPSPQKKAKGGLAVGDQLPEFEMQTDEEKVLSSVDMVSSQGRMGLGRPGLAVRQHLSGTSCLVSPRNVQ